MRGAEFADTTSESRYLLFLDVTGVPDVSGGTSGRKLTNLKGRNKHECICASTECTTALRLESQLIRESQKMDRTATWSDFPRGVRNNFICRRGKGDAQVIYVQIRGKILLLGKLSIGCGLTV